MNAPDSIDTDHLVPDFPTLFLVLVAGLVFVLAELALAEWAFFYAAAPSLSLCFLVWFLVTRPGFLPLPVILFLALFAEIMGLDELGVRVVSWSFIWLVFEWRRGVQTESDFLSLWSFFAAIVLLQALFRMAVFVLDHLRLPELSSLAVQTGFTIFLFPVIFVMIYWVGLVWQRWTGIFSLKR